MKAPRVGIYASLGNTDPVLSRPENIAKLARCDCGIDAALSAEPGERAT